MNIVLFVNAPYKQARYHGLSRKEKMPLPWANAKSISHILLLIILIMRPEFATTRRMIKVHHFAASAKIDVNYGG